MKKKKIIKDEAILRAFICMIHAQPKVMLSPKLQCEDIHT